MFKTPKDYLFVYIQISIKAKEEHPEYFADKLLKTQRGNISIYGTDDENEVSILDNYMTQASSDIHYIKYHLDRDLPNNYIDFVSTTNDIYHESTLKQLLFKLMLDYLFILIKDYFKGFWLEERDESSTITTKETAEKLLKTVTNFISDPNCLTIEDLLQEVADEMKGSQSSPNKNTFYPERSCLQKEWVFMIHTSDCPKVVADEVIDLWGYYDVREEISVLLNDKLYELAPRLYLWLEYKGVKENEVVYLFDSYNIFNKHF